MSVDTITRRRSCHSVGMISKNEVTSVENKVKGHMKCSAVQ